MAHEKVVLSVEEAWKALETVVDPEIPVVSLVEMGIVQDVLRMDDGTLKIVITPTFAGCPALHVMQKDIINTLKALGETSVQVSVTLTPPWTTEFIAESAREKLRDFGIAPPPRHSGNFELVLVQMVDCPFCGSGNTEIRNAFGPTPCRSLSFCFDCQQPFEHIKPL
jgi:ring-1,2-phenylacetyl-CoA epoxidase subunit PaaD